MARSKKQSHGAPVSHSRSISSVSPSATSGSTQRLQPYVDHVDVNNDDQELGRTKGVLAGLDPNAILGPSQRNVQTLGNRADDDVELSGGDDCIEASQPTHATRGSIYGRAAVNYDQKFHPMDTTIRPKRAAKRLSGFDHLPKVALCEGDDLTSDEELSLASGSGSDDEDESIAHPQARAMKQRIPDPGATRHSARSQARKNVNYNTKVHPQDYALPFYRHNAELEVSDSLSACQKEPRSQNRNGKSSIIYRGVSSIHSRPRKRLRIHESSPRLPAVTRKRVRKHEQITTSTDTEELANQAIRGSQAQPVVLADEHDDNDEALHDDEDDYDHEEAELENQFDRELAQDIGDDNDNLEFEIEEGHQGSDFEDHFAVTAGHSFGEDFVPALIAAKIATEDHAIPIKPGRIDGISFSRTLISQPTTAVGSASPTTTVAYPTTETVKSPPNGLEADDMPSTAPPSSVEPLAESSFVRERPPTQRSAFWQTGDAEIQNTSSSAVELDSEPTSASGQSDDIPGEVESVLAD